MLDVLKENRLSRDHLQIHVMAEILSNIILAERFADLFIENDQAVKQQIQDLIEVAHKKGRKAGICGQRPSDDLEFAAFLVQYGIDSLSLTPDSFIQNIHQVSNI